MTGEIPERDVACAPPRESSTAVRCISAPATPFQLYTHHRANWSGEKGFSRTSRCSSSAPPVACDEIAPGPM
ncbi:hypothetical protein Trydic_g4903 [Trypoxylus dichotomus]